MGMNVGSGAEGDVMVEVNTTPLIDLMLVLIVMLIITLPPQTHAVKLDMPVSTTPPNPNDIKPVVVEIIVDFDTTIYWDGSRIENAQMLKNRLTWAAHQDPKPELHLKPNKLAKYDAVAKVLATAQRLGVTNIGIVGNEAME